MPIFVGGVSPLVGGWFGYTGESLPDEGALTDGWFWGDQTIDDINNRLTRLEALLLANKPIFINIDGNLQELDIGLES